MRRKERDGKKNPTIYRLWGVATKMDAFLSQARPDRKNIPKGLREGTGGIVVTKKHWLAIGDGVSVLRRGSGKGVVSRS